MEDSIREKIFVNKKTSTSCRIWRIICYVLSVLCLVVGIIAGLGNYWLFFICLGAAPCMVGAICFRVMELISEKTEIDLALLRKNYWDIPEVKDDIDYL